MLIDFNLALLSLTQNSLSETNLQIQTAPRIKVAIFFFMEQPVQNIFIVLCVLNLFWFVEFAESKV